MVNVNVISVLMMLNLYSNFSGANEIDFKMWVDARKKENFFFIHFICSFVFRVRDLAKQIGDELTTLAESVSRRAEIQEVNKFYLQLILSTFYAFSRAQWRHRKIVFVKLRGLCVMVNEKSRAQESIIWSVTSCTNQ